MLVFVVPLKSRSVARSWPRTCQVFERAVRSICRQTSPDFQVLVVCHDVPEVDFSHPNVHYVPVAFPPPTDERRSRLMDRWRKELVGEIAARRFGPCHLMKADADDCVSRRLAGFVARHPDADGWYIDRGYVYLEGGHHVRPRRSGFHRWCGTCNIVRSTHVGTFASLLADTLADTPASAEIARRHYVPHMDLADVMSARGTPLGRLPFPGAVYVVGHGDNSGAIEAEQVFLSRRPLVRAVRRLVSLRAITRDIREEFGLYDLDGPPGPGGH